MQIIDMAKSPNYNPSTNKDRDTWSLFDVTNKEVTIDENTNKPKCIEHNAMNCVSSDRSIWRCLICSRSCIDLDKLDRT